MRDYESVEDLIKGLRSYFPFYNNERPHQSLGGKAHAEVYFRSSELKKAAYPWVTKVPFLYNLTFIKNGFNNGVRLTVKFIPRWKRMRETIERR